ncbi:uncharacterized protein [Eucyclogobius newberryi]|uniref:uncharacterized protein n=1 Tax=Eucyclogobius newberryi TaxID=166745 RepID=UPI003B5C4193
MAEHASYDLPAIQGSRQSVSRISEIKPNNRKSHKRKSRDSGSCVDNKPTKHRSEKAISSGPERKVQKRKKKEEPLRTELRGVAKAGNWKDFEQKYEQDMELKRGKEVFAGVRVSDRQPVAIKYTKSKTVTFVPVHFEDQVYDVPLEAFLMSIAAPDQGSIGLYPTVSFLEWFILDLNMIVLVMERPTPSLDMLEYSMVNAPLSEEQVKVMIKQVVDALVDLHSKGVFHKDISRDNLLVQITESGPRIRIIDFGCGQLIQRQPFQTGPRGCVPCKYTTRSSFAAALTVLQIGSVLYELLFSNDSEFTTVDFMKGKISARSATSRGSRQLVSRISEIKPNNRKSLKRKSRDSGSCVDNKPTKHRSEKAISSGPERKVQKRKKKEEPLRTELRGVAKAGRSSQSVSDVSENEPSKKKESDAEFENEAKKSYFEKSSSSGKKDEERSELGPESGAGDTKDFEEKYKQLMELGEGYFGTVFAGVRISDQQPVALKYIERRSISFLPVHFEDEVYDVPLEAFLMSKAAPDQGSIGLYPTVSFLEWFILDLNMIVLVMERPTPSLDLLDYNLENVPLSEEHAKVMIKQVVDALVDLHSKGVFHKDISRDNLLVQITESGPRIRIIDFGCGQLIQRQPFQTGNISNQCSSFCMK